MQGPQPLNVVRGSPCMVPCFTLKLHVDDMLAKSTISNSIKNRNDNKANRGMDRKQSLPTLSQNIRVTKSARITKTIT